MCCQNPNYTAKANQAKCWAIVSLVFAIITLLSFAVGGYASGIGSILTIVGTSLVICCGPAKAGAGAGCKFKAASILVLIGAIVHIVGLVLMLMVVVGSGNNTNQLCLEGYCEQSKYRVVSCGSYMCASETMCKTDSSSSAVQACGLGASIVAAWFSIILWPAIVLSGLTAIFELLCAIFSFQAAGTMEKGTATIQPAA